MTGLDDKDRKIIGLLQDNPHASQSDIAAAADLSQPAVSLRIKKLMEQGFISRSIGVDIQRLDLPIAKLEIAHNGDRQMLDTFTRCPYIVDVLHMQNATRLSLFMVGETESTIHSVASRMQEHDGLELLHYDTIATTQNRVVHPLQLPDQPDGACRHCACASCSHHKKERCMGCPLTPLYRGEIW
ncbi:MAG: winged helix-turn-helix transcriptional regulator [Thermoplasmatota archaeon]